MNESVRFGLARLVAERCCSDLDIPINNLSIMEETLAEMSGIPAAKLTEVLWGGNPSFELEESETLALLLHFDPELFSCLVRPTSREILNHTLRSIGASDLDPYCEDCQDMREWIEEIELLDHDTAGQLALDLLGHLRVGDAVEEVAPSVGEDEEVLLRVFRNLSGESRARVLAYAYSERGAAPADQRSSNSYIYSRLRRDYLSPLARDVLDQLATEPEGILPARELAGRLKLSDARSIGQVPRSLQSSLRALRADGYTLDEPPLQVLRRGRESVYRLSPQALGFWQSMLAAEADRTVGEGHYG